MKLTDSIVTAISAILHPEKQKTINYAKLLKSKQGLEIGGPSDFFKRKSYYPAYLYAGRIDGVNFNANTVWEGTIKEGNTYQYLNGHRPGKQYISEAATLTGIDREQYDFILSCHSLEHIANPLRALKRWNEVLKPGGTLAVIVPNKEITFDKNRDYTSFAHLVADFENEVDEQDETHFREVIDKHVLDLDAGIEDLETLKLRTTNNFINRCVHHHVFSFEVLREALAFCGFEVLLQKEIHVLNLFTLARKKA